jgi:hypothetical protein
MTDPRDPSMHQSAPFPRILADLVQKLRYREGWTFALSDIDRDQRCIGLTLVITTFGVNSYHPEQTGYSVYHYMIVPAAAYDERSWRRWLLEQLLLVERHECMEFFQIGDDKPYAPSHGYGQDPYIVRELGTDEDRRMSFRNELNA